MFFALLSLGAQHESLERALARSADLDRDLESLVREAVRLGARGGPADETRARAALAAIDPARRAEEFRRRIIDGGASRRFVLSEVAAWRDRAFLRPVLAVFLTVDDAADRRAARETLRALADETLVDRLAEELDSPSSDASLRRALELAGEHGDARLAGRLVLRLGPVVRLLEELRAAGGLAADRADEQERHLVLLLAALRRCSGRDFGSDWRAWEAWAREPR